jgi:hypothetical protein
MWTPISPLPSDFCGHPPCPKCYCWADDLLDKDISTASKDEKKQLKAVADRIHNEGLCVAVVPPIILPPDPIADLGMTDADHINGWLRERRPEKPKAPQRQLTCDEVYDRQNAREEARKTKKRERDERLKEAKEIAEIFAAAQPRGSNNNTEMEALARAGVDPMFIRYMNERGVFNASEIYDRARREGAMRPDMRMPSFMVNPNDPIRY